MVEQEKTKYIVGFRCVEELYAKQTSEIAFLILNKDIGFMDLFKQNKRPN